MLVLQVRPEVLDLHPYVAGKGAAEVRSAFGVRSVVKLASNENPLGPSPLALRAVRSQASTGQIYPDPASTSLRQALSRHLGVPADWLLVGNGSDEVLRLLAAAYIRAGDRCLLPDCTFPTYRTVCRLFGGAIQTVPLRDETMDLPAMCRAAAGARLICLCRPNNPTGAVFAEAAFRQFMAAVDPQTLVLIDEAYAEFDGSGFDSLGLLRDFPNLVLTRTFSKAYGLAGYRVGYGIARPEVWQPIYRVREPFSVNALAQAAAEAALADTAHLQATLANNEAGRAYLEAAFDRLGLAYVRSYANFILVDLGQPATPIFEALLRRGVIVRPGDGFGRPTCLRVSIGTPAGNRRCVTALRAALGRRTGAGAAAGGKGG